MQHPSKIYKALLIAISYAVDRKFDANLTSFIGILSTADVFLVLRNFRIKFYSLEVTCLAIGEVLLELK